MSPAPHTYLDQKYDEETELGLTWAGAVEVRDAYEWDPERVIDRAEVLGVEAALWTETTETRSDIDSMVFPRLLAMAEVGWSGPARLGGLPRAARRSRPAAERARRRLPPLKAGRVV